MAFHGKAQRTWRTLRGFELRKQQLIVVHIHCIEAGGREVETVRSRRGWDLRWSEAILPNITTLESISATLLPSQHATRIPLQILIKMNRYIHRNHTPSISSIINRQSSASSPLACALLTVNIRNSGRPTPSRSTSRAFWNRATFYGTLQLPP